MNVSGMHTGAGIYPAPRSQSQVNTGPRKSPQELMERVQMNNKNAEELHMAKTQMSNANFKNAKITTGKAVLMKNGVAVALAFPTRPKIAEQSKSSEVASFSTDTYKIRENLHAGMTKKPLERYHPNAHRSRLPSPTVMMPYKNSSQIVIGDRSSHYKRQFVTTNTNSFCKPDHLITTNPGIVSEVQKRKKHSAAQ